MELIMIIDTHAHYDDEAFSKDRDNLLRSLRENNIEWIVNVGASMQTSRATVILTKQYEFVYGAVGVHPNETKDLTEEDMQELKEYTDRKKIVAIGEIGLDYYWDTPSREIQKKWFIRQLELAKEVQKPIIIHSRDAARDTYEILSSSEYKYMSGVIHCYSYGVEEAKKYLDMNYFLGIGGVVTFHNAKKLKEVVAYAPLSRLVLETDCPYLSPVPNRGKRNSSLNLSYVVEEIARIKECPKEEVIRVTNENAKRLYQI